MDTPDLANFQPAGPNIDLYTPQSKAPTALIVLCTWLGGATPRRIANYTSGYIQNFANAAILLVKTALPDIMIQSNSAIWARLAPAREVIAKFIRSKSSTGVGTAPLPVLLHIFSHGGSNIATQLMRSFQATDPTNHDPLLAALRVVVLDCCPGDSSFQRNYNAMAVSLPSASKQPITHYVGRTLLYPAVGLILSLMAAGVMQSIEDLRKELNDPELFGRTAKRLYLYSAEDEMVRWEDVERHMNEGREKGYEVDGMIFDEGQHCALVMVDKERYWDAIRRAWAGEGPESALRSRL
ncbi:hypothetical protein BDW75DRAFT_248188 [Aspergillus navahoensis]